MNMRDFASVSLGAAGMLLATTVLAHHSYAMFDNTRRLTVSGTVAKHEWKNPHTYIWVYVQSTQQPGKYELYGFENGSPNAMQKEGWSKDSLQQNDRITVEYIPLRDGRTGGHCAKVTLSDGRVLACDGIARFPQGRSSPAPEARQ
jgi:hypothetical protein